MSDPRAMELFAQAYQQLAAISAVLGGLAFTAAAALLAVGAGTSASTALGRPAKITVATAVWSAVALVIAALMWSLMAADVSRAAARGEISLARSITALNPIPSVALIVGLVLFFASLGASGWVASRRLGQLTSVAGAIGILGLWLILYWFSDLRPLTVIAGATGSFGLLLVLYWFSNERPR